MALVPNLRTAEFQVPEISTKKQKNPECGSLCRGPDPPTIRVFLAPKAALFVPSGPAAA
jgi:hypothetical protein